MAWAANTTSWGDEVAQGGKELLPAPTVEGPDASGLKTITTFRHNDKGQVEKVVRVIRVIEHEKRISIGARNRQASWKKFGKASGEEEQGITLQQNDPINIQLPGETEKTPIQKAVEENGAGGGGGTMKCRKCGGAHWTVTCVLGKEGGAPAAGGGAAAGSGKYVPPSVRSKPAGGAEAAGEIPEEELTGLRVGNLSDDATEDELRHLFGQFGSLDKVYIAYDRITKEPRGFAFVKYTMHAYAKAAKTALQGFPLHNLIIDVDWSRPSTGGAGGMGSGPGYKYTGYGKKLAQDVAPTAGTRRY